MENESLFILISTAVGGYLGLDGSTEAVNEACGGQLANECVLLVGDHAWTIPRVVMEAFIGPGATLSGLVCGLLVGTVLVGIYRLAQYTQSKSD